MSDKQSPNTMTPEEIRDIRSRVLRQTQAEFAHMLGVSARSVRHWEGGTRKAQKSVVRSIRRICRHKGVMDDEHNIIEEAVASDAR